MNRKTSQSTISILGTVGEKEGRMACWLPRYLGLYLNLIEKISIYENNINNPTFRGFPKLKELPGSLIPTVTWAGRCQNKLGDRRVSCN
jgi:hypothetical protein